jgi:hypothetical protein
MSSPLYSLLADRIENMSYKGYIVTETLPTNVSYSNSIPPIVVEGFPLYRNGSYSVASADPNVVGETCLANPLQRSGFQAVRHSIMFKIYHYLLSHCSLKHAHTSKYVLFSWFQ